MRLWNEPYQLKTFQGDFFGGVTAGIVALPLALAFGVASGAGAAAGLYGAIALGFFASLFGGTRTQISGPTGPMTVVVAATALSLGSEWPLVMAAILLAGLFQIIFGVLGMGRFVRYIPYPVISGFMSGIGVIIILLQLPVLMGGEPQSSTLVALLTLPASMLHVDVVSLLLGMGTLGVLFFTPKKVARFFPPPLLALVLFTPLSLFVGADVARIGEIPTGLPELSLPHVTPQQFSLLLSSAMTLALLGSIDTLLTSLVADSLTKTRHDSRRELVGQGVGNMAASLVGGLPGAGATMRTVVNIKSGGTTPVSGIIHALLLFVLLIGAAPLATEIPLAVLAGILIKVGVDILDYKFIRILMRAPRHDLYVMVAVFGLTVFVDLIIAVGVGITLASLLLTVRIAKETGIHISTPQEQDTGDLQALVHSDSDRKIRIINIDGAFFFGSTSQIIEQVDQAMGTKVLIFNCKAVPFLDLSALFALEEMWLKLHDQEVEVLIVVGSERIRNKLLRFDVGKMLGEERIFMSELPCILKAREFLAHS